MMPSLVTVRYRRGNGRRVRLFVPVLPALLVLSPLVLLVMLGGMAACVVFRVSPVGALRGLAQLLGALPGTRIEVSQGSTAVLINVR